MGIGRVIADLIKWRNNRIDFIGNNFIRNFSYLLNFIAVVVPVIFIEMSLICIMSGVVSPITALFLSSFAIFFVAAILPVVLSYSIGVIKKALNDKLSKELKKEGVEPSRILDLFTCVKDLEFTVSKLGIKGLMLIFDCDKLNIDDIKEILNNKEIVNGLNSIHKNNLELILNFDKLDRLDIKEILSNQEAVNGLNSIHENKLKLILKFDKLGGCYIRGTLSNQEVVNRLNSTHENKLELIFICNKLDRCDIMDILRNQEAFNGLNSINENRLKIILNSPRLKGENIKLILNNQEVFNGLNSINEDKL